MKKIKLNVVEFKKLPALEQSPNSKFKTNFKQNLLLGGFSSLELISIKKNIYQFRTITDRGPNGPLIKSDPSLGQNLRPFFIPHYSPVLVDFDFDLKKNKIQNIKTQKLFAKNGALISGLPPFAQNKKNSDLVEQAIFNQTKLTYDINGFDSEGHCTDRFGRTWVSEEYYPSVAVFDLEKKLLKRFLPGKDFSQIFANRKTNRGFEGMTCDSKYVYVMLQSPIAFKKSENKSVVRILRFDLTTLKAVDQFVYHLENKNVDKIGDISVGPNKSFFVLEQNGQIGIKSKQFIFKIKLNHRNAIPLKENPELWSKQKNTEKCVPKKWVANLSGSKTSQIEKIEGMAIHKNKIFLIVDNDFGLVENKKNGQISIDNKIKPKLIWFKFKSKDK